MSDPSSWWARIKYIENFVDYVPVFQLFECDENMQKKTPFQPRHLKDFEPEKYYIVQTHKFNNLQSKKHDIYYALVGYLVESRDSIMCDMESTACQWPATLEGSFKPRKCSDKCKDIEENGNSSKNIKKKCKASRMCCCFDKNKLYPLLSLITELKNDSETTKRSIHKQFIEVINNYSGLKKRLYTDLCIYVPIHDNPDLSHSRLSFLNFFCLLKRWNDSLKLKCMSTYEELEELFCQIENLHVGTTTLPITTLLLVRLLNTRLLGLELALLRFLHFFLCLKDKVLAIEEQFGIVTIDIQNTGIEMEMASTVYTHYGSAILESLSELQELVNKETDIVILSSS